VWKNIRERVQKYDRKLTKTSALKNFFTLIWRGFQRITQLLFQIMSFFYERLLNKRAYLIGHKKLTRFLSHF